MMSSSNDGRWMALTLRIMGRLPLGLVTAFGAFLGWLVAVTPLRFASARRYVLINLLAAYPFLSWHEVRRLGRRSLVQTGRSFAEFAHVWTRPVSESLARISHVEGWDDFRAAVASERPVLLLSLHQSSWELNNLLVGQETPALVMYQPDSRTAVDDLVREAREKGGCKLIPTNPSGVKKALAALSSGGTLALLADHNPGMRSNPYVPFFGHLVPTPGLIHKFVKRYRPHIFLVGCYRGRGHRDVRVLFQPAPDMERGESEYETLWAMNRGLEKLIGRSPEQYQWTYQRFKRGPDGRRLWYRQSRELLRRAKSGEDRQSLGLYPETLNDGAGESGAGESQ